MFSRVGLALVLAFSLAGRAMAHGGDTGPQLVKDAPAVTKDGEKAKAELARVGAAPEGPKELLAEPLKKGKAAIARAHGASLAGDEAGAKLLSRVALAWAQAAAATLRAFDSERGADSAERKMTAQKDQIQRKKALLVEMEARKMSLTKEVAAAESDAKSAPAARAADPAKKKGDKADAKAPPNKPSDKTDKQPAKPPSEKPKK
jgi:hypothetical protein